NEVDLDRPQARRPSKILQLPLELHHLIASFSPPPTVNLLSSLCHVLRSIYRQLFFDSISRTVIQEMSECHVEDHERPHVFKNSTVTVSSHGVHIYPYAPRSKQERRSAEFVYHVPFEHIFIP